MGALSRVVRASARGVTLVEVLIGALLLVVLGVPVMAVLHTGTVETLSSEDYMEAEVLSSRQIERALSQRYAELAARVPFTERVTFACQPSSGGVVESDQAGKLRTYRLELKAKAVGDDMLMLEVTADWQISGKPRRYGLARLRTREDLSMGGRPRE